MLFAVAAGVGAAYIRTVLAGGGQPRFYQGEFGPAVMAACGRGYQNPDLDSRPDLSAFLNLETDTFSCDALGSEVALRPLTPMQRAFRYQELTIAATWRWTGVSWSGLAPLYGIFFGLTIVTAYGLFRTAMGPAIAGLCAIALTGSTIHLIYLPHFRDYSKAPFLLAAILCVAWIARYAMSPRRLLLLSAAFGLLIGVGVGFRNDLLIAVPPFVAAVLVFLPGSLFGQWRIKLASLATCLLALWLAMFPMRAIYAPGGGNSMQHVLVLGLGDSFNADLGVTNDGMYGWGYTFKDDYAHALGSAYAARMQGVDRPLELYSGEYDRASSAYLAGVAAMFPADMLVRVYAAVIKTLGIPYNKTSLQPPTLVSDAHIARAYHGRERVLRAMGAAWPWLLMAALFGVTVRNLKLAAFVAFIVLYFSAYPVLQFNERHFFHLEFISWLGLGLVVQYVATAARSAFGAEGRAAWLAWWRERHWVKPARTAVLCWAGAVALIVVPLSVLRAWQQRTVRAGFDRLIALDKQPLDLTGQLQPGGLLRLDSPARAIVPAGEHAVTSAYLVAEFASGACDTLKFDAIFQYHASSFEHDFSRTIEIQPPLVRPGVARLFVPVYVHPVPSPTMGGTYTFAGVDIPESAAPCLTGLYKVRDVSGLPLLLDVNLPAGWEEATLYQTIAGLESRRYAEVRPDVYTFPSDLPVGRHLLARDIVPLGAGDIEEHSGNVRVTDTGWDVDGAGGIGGRGPFLYLARMRPRAARQGDLVMARGQLRSGGLSVGLLKDGAWVAQVPVQTPGDFQVVVRVPEDGVYTLVVANNLTGRSLDNQLTIERIGWASGA